jgi:hypothetical protein
MEFLVLVDDDNQPPRQTQSLIVPGIGLKPQTDCLIGMQDLLRCVCGMRKSIHVCVFAQEAPRRFWMSGQRTRFQPAPDPFALRIGRTKKPGADCTGFLCINLAG